MTVYTIEAMTVTTNYFGSISGSETVEIAVDIEGTNPGFYIWTDENNVYPYTYSLSSYDLVHLTWSGTVNEVTVDGSSGFGLFEGGTGLFYDMTWGNGAYETTVLYYNDASTRTEYFIAVEGDALPDLNGVSDAQDFLDGIGRLSGFVPLGYGPLDLVQFEDLVAYEGNMPSGPRDRIGTFLSDRLESSDTYGELMQGLEGNDTLYGLGGDDTLQGGAGDDYLYGGEGSDSLDGGTGDDYISFDAADAFIGGGEGSDTIALSDYGLVGQVDLDLGAGTITLPGEAANNFSDIENASIYLSSTTTTLSADLSQDANWLFFFTGDSTVNGLGGDDTIWSGSGNDLIDGGLGDDELDTYSGDDDVTAGLGNDRVRAGSGADTVDAGGGNDTVYGGSGADSIDGGADADELYGDYENDTLLGGAGDDTLNGGEGDDSVDGGLGDDFVYASTGLDVLIGGTGHDTISYEGADSRMILDLQNAARNLGLAADHTVSEFEVVLGSDFNDQLRGDADINELNGGAHNDRLYGRGGDDVLNGGEGYDAIFGNLGADWMSGGGDTQRDRFIYFQITESGVGAGYRDIILDFDAAADRIEIRRFDADVTTGGKQYFDFVGYEGLTGTAGQLAYVHEGGNTVVQADVDGDGLADFEIELSGELTLSADNFFI